MSCLQWANVQTCGVQPLKRTSPPLCTTSSAVHFAACFFGHMTADQVPAIQNIPDSHIMPDCSKLHKPERIAADVGAAADNAPAGSPSHAAAATAQPSSKDAMKSSSRSSSIHSTYPSIAARQALFYEGIEQVEEVEAAVQGSIPAWLDGSLVMNGGGDYTPMRHLFDGYGLLSKVRLQGGRAWGSQRYIDTQVLRAYRQSGQVVANEFATPPGSLWAYMQQQRSTSSSTTTSSSSSTGLAKQPAQQQRALQLLAITEDPFGSYLVDPDTLHTVKQVQYPDRMPCIMQSPHPAMQSDGSLLNISRTFPFGGSHVYLKTGPHWPGRRWAPIRDAASASGREQVAFVPDRHWLAPAWMHDFASTDRHAVLLEQPLYLDFLGMVGGWDNDAAWMKWRPREGVAVHVATLDGSKPVRTFTVPAFAYVHIGNAFESEDGSMLHVDLGVFGDAQILNDLKLQALRHGPEQGRQVSRCAYMRLDVPLDCTGPLQLPGPKPLVEHAAAKHVDFVDFFNVHPALKGRPYRYVYSTCAVRPTHINNGLAKTDLATQEVQLWHSPGGVTGEPHFVPQPHAAAAGGAATAAEDAGVVLSQCVDAQGRAFLLVLDAASWRELGRAVLPYSTPYRFHGVWVPREVAA
ncbi:retinal pigment epithelial membrane protein-domain-containing protein [Scenedesmus sp. NREL 46B-D3]|nr:retinal pigment epithelial membrane protein-domain-containing protein [Scenedesmus sp. NREL 46B-D3]